MAHAQLGLGSITGYAGVLAGVNVIDRLELGAGLGVAGSGNPAFAFYAHVRPIVFYARGRRTLHAITVQLGYSWSRYDSIDLAGLIGSDPAVGIGQHVPVARWFQYDFGWEMLTPSGFDVRAAFGVAILTNKEDVYCTNADGRTECGKPLEGLPSLALSMGHTF